MPTYDFSYPHPPRNPLLTTAFVIGYLDLRWGNSQDIPENKHRNIIGYHVYRSFDSEFGEFSRITSIPIGVTQYRDQTINTQIVNENVTGQFISHGDDSLGKWVFKTCNYPIVKDTAQAQVANHPKDVVVKIDNVPVIVEKVDGYLGEVTLISTGYFDFSSQKIIQPILPNSNSIVTCSYRYNSNLVKADLTQRVFYKITSVDSEENETPLEKCETVNNHRVEPFDWIFSEAMRRTAWMLEQSGKRVKIFIKKSNGEKCPNCFSNYHKQSRSDCKICYNTSYISGYLGPWDAIIAPPEATRSIVQSEYGKKVEYSWESFMGPSPLLSTGDFIVTRENVRYTVSQVNAQGQRDTFFQQHFQLSQLLENDPRMFVPISGSIYEIPNSYNQFLNNPTTPSDPTLNANYDSQHILTPGILDYKITPKIQRIIGRTPVFENIHS